MVFLREDQSGECLVVSWFAIKRFGENMPIYRMAGGEFPGLLAIMVLMTSWAKGTQLPGIIS